MFVSLYFYILTLPNITPLQRTRRVRIVRELTLLQKLCNSEMQACISETQTRDAWGLNHIILRLKKGISETPSRYLWDSNQEVLRLNQVFLRLKLCNSETQLLVPENQAIWSWGLNVRLTWAYFGLLWLVWTYFALLWPALPCFVLPCLALTYFALLWPPLPCFVVLPCYQSSLLSYHQVQLTYRIQLTTTKLLPSHLAATKLLP